MDQLALVFAPPPGLGHNHCGVDRSDRGADCPARRNAF